MPCFKRLMCVCVCVCVCVSGGWGMGRVIPGVASKQGGQVHVVGIGAEIFPVAPTKGAQRILSAAAPMRALQC